MNSFQLKDRVIVNSGAVKGVSGKIVARSACTSNLTVLLDDGQTVNVMPYEVRHEGSLPTIDAPAKVLEMWGNLQQDLHRAAIADLRAALEVYVHENRGGGIDDIEISKFIDWLEARGKK